MGWGERGGGWVSLGGVEEGCFEEVEEFGGSVEVVVGERAFAAFSSLIAERRRRHGFWHGFSRRSLPGAAERERVDRHKSGGEGSRESGARRRGRGRSRPLTVIVRRWPAAALSLGVAFARLLPFSFSWERFRSGFRLPGTPRKDRTRPHAARRGKSAGGTSGGGRSEREKFCAEMDASKKAGTRLA